MGRRGDKELRELTERSTRRALKIQAREYERRLSELNGEAGRIRDILANTVPREKFEDYKGENARIREGSIRELETKIDAMDARITVNTRALQRLDGAVSLVRFLGVAGLVGVAIGLWNIFGRPV